jgi:hypothetical protein
MFVELIAEAEIVKFGNLSVGRTRCEPMNDIRRLQSNLANKFAAQLVNELRQIEEECQVMTSFPVTDAKRGKFSTQKCNNVE